MELMRESNTLADRNLLSDPDPPGTRQRIPVTTVRMLFAEGAKNYRLLFGRPLRIETVSQREGYTAAIARFAPGARFGLDLWALECLRHDPVALLRVRGDRPGRRGRVRALCGTGSAGVAQDKRCGAIAGVSRLARPA